MEKYSKTMSFLTGIDKYGAKPPIGLPYRFAVLTWFECKGSEDPWPLLKTAVPEIVSALSVDNVVCEYWHRHWDMKYFGLFRKWVEKKEREINYQNLQLKNDEELEKGGFPTNIKFYKNGELILAEESEFWSRCGGPAPYSDSVTLSFFSKEDRSTMLQKLFTDAAKTVGAEIRKNGKKWCVPFR
jgi:hypothetical protein